jgi:hypothetical protein
MISWACAGTWVIIGVDPESVLDTNLSFEERRFVERRVAEERVALRRLTGGATSKDTAADAPAFSQQQH